MSSLLVLLNPSANRVYAGQVAAISAAELAALTGTDVRQVTVAGVPYLELDASADAPALARCSGRLAVFRREGELLRPVAVPDTDLFDDDLVTIPKYPGKTNEQFTRLMMNLTLAAAERQGPLTVLDPLCGRGTTLLTAWTLGHNAAGVDADGKALHTLADYLRSYLRRKRISHRVSMDPVRREGRSLGRKLDASATVNGTELSLTAYPGDARTSADLFGRKTFDAIVTDAPYGVVHGSRRAGGTQSGGAAQGQAPRARSAAALLADALPIWARQLRSGGAIGIAWNTYSLPRSELAELARNAGLTPVQSEPYLAVAHRVDSAIHRDLLVARKP
ncbi:site-specific DNA-methyltransferase [Nakamurella aerolata]|uniref:Site-specific DNA-methyltransferase n=1 Tax=Nakamurella aerolata TaxID=1656892 RepID=A0A849ACJ3_9ACTN|nr:site-specific DNA-methyltransferase [Nakamurella aerolata]